MTLHSKNLKNQAVSKPNNPTHPLNSFSLYHNNNNNKNSAQNEIVNNNNNGNLYVEYKNKNENRKKNRNKNKSKNKEKNKLHKHKFKKVRYNSTTRKMLRKKKALLERVFIDKDIRNDFHMNSNQTSLFIKADFKAKKKSNWDDSVI